MARDIAGLLTGISSTQQPVQQAVPGSPNFYGEFMAARGRGLQQGLGGLLRGGEPSTQERIQGALSQLDLNNPDDLATLAKVQQARGDLAGAAQTASKIEALRERERLIKENEEKKLLDAQNKTATEKESARRWEAEQKLREQRIDLDRQRLKNQGPSGVRKMLDKDVQRISGYEDQADLSLGESTRALDLANRYASMKPTGGVVGKAYGAFKSLLGTQTKIDSLKTEFTRLKNTGIINSLPPGVASDRDIALISGGFPDSSWSPKEIERFLRAVAKVAAYDAEKNMFKAEYSKNNGGIETGMTRAWRKKINEPGYKETVSETYGLEYDIPTQQEVFDADEMARIKAQTEQENIANYGKEFSTPDVSALTN